MAPENQPPKTETSASETQADLRGGTEESSSGLNLERNNTSGSIHTTGPRSTPFGSGEQAGIPDGSLLGERFRIVRFIARGGMGEVYEAEDLELREHVALKTVLPQIAGDERVMKRFKQEIYLARKVNSPQVCRINDLFRHKPVAEGPADQFRHEVNFLTMELLPGESLAALLQRKERLTAEEAFPLVQQMCRGLAAAHEVNVVHRDFKTANVMLVPGKNGLLRAVITDFGLAHTSERAGGQFSLTGSDDIVGTPAYMAPEQVEGGRDITAAADIYALGVVMYEMVTGGWPFQAETRLGMAMARLQQTPQRPSERVPGLAPAWDRTIMRCLARYPQDRFAHVAEVVDSLGGKQSAIVTPKNESTRPVPRSQRWLSGIFALMLLLAGLAAYRYWPRRGTTQQVSAKPAVAVLGLRNVTGRQEDAWIATALAEMLTTELATSSQVRTVPADQVARSKTELSIPDSDTVPGENLALLQASLGTGYWVVGSYSVTGKEGSRALRVDLRLVNSAGETIGSFADNGTEDRMSDTAVRLGSALRNKLGIIEVKPEVSQAVQGMLPQDREAARLYSEGVAKLRSFDAAGARDLLQKASTIEPSSPAIHSSLAMAWNVLGYDEQAKSEAKQAFDLADKIKDLPQDFRFLLEGRYYEMANQWDKAADVYSSLHRFYPDNVEYGLRLAAAETSGGKATDAVTVYQDLRKLPPPLGSDVRIDIGMAEAAEVLGNNDAEGKAATEAARRAESTKAKLSQARALVLQCIALGKIGKYQDAKTQCDSSEQIYSVFGDRMGAAWARNNLGNILVENGQYADARAAYEQALKIATDVGAKPHMAGALLNIGRTYYESGDNQNARKYYGQALTLAQSIGDKKQTALALNNDAGTLLVMGELREAAKRFEESARVSEQIGDSDTQAYALSNLGMIEAQTGELSEARKNYDEALALWKKSDAKPSQVTCLTGLAEILADSGDSSGANRKIEEAAALTKELNNKPATASVQLSQSQVALTARNLAQAKQSAKQAIGSFDEIKDLDNENLARVLLVEALIREGSVAEARATQDALDKSPSDVKGVLLAAQYSKALLAVNAGQAAGIGALKDLIKASASQGFTRIELQARLALAEDSAADRRTEAGIVQQRAKTAGYVEMAKRAAELLR